jgi:hypothetical protein
MKRITIVLITLLLGVAALAQEAHLQKATGYTKDGVLFYQLSGCVPHSQVEFYSNPSGGKLLATVSADAQGQALAEVPEKTTYAFALNRVSPTKGGQAGAAYYIALGQPVLELQSVTENDRELRWQVTAKGEGVHCEVFGGNEGGALQKVATLLQQSGLNLGHYQANGNADSYMVQVLDPDNGLRVTIGGTVLSFKKPGGVKLSPTVFTSVLNVQLLEVQAGTLQVFNGSGALVHSTAVRQGANAIDLSGMAPANYIVKINDRNNRTVYSGRVVKGQ